VGLERGPFSLVRIIEEPLEWKSSGSGQENRINGRGIRCADHATPSIRKKLALTSPTSGGLLVGIVRLRTKGHGVFSEPWWPFLKVWYYSRWSWVYMLRVMSMVFVSYTADIRRTSGHHNLCSLSDVVRVIESSSLRWEGYVACMREMRNT
jgi:hypothetical protein